MRKVLLISSNSGTSFWRCKNPLELLRDNNLIKLVWMPIELVPTEMSFIKQFDAIVFHQSWSTKSLTIAAMAHSSSTQIILSIDDLLNGYKIPNYIGASSVYRQSEVTRCIHDMCELADRIVTTTPTLRDEMSEFFQVQSYKWHLLPNFPSFNWLGRLFNLSRLVDAHKTICLSRKIRIGVISSLSHYSKDICKANDASAKDDLSIVEDALPHLNDIHIQWVLTTNKDNKIHERLPDSEVNDMCLIKDYPTYISNLNLDLVVVPLLDSDFNNCKSNIKLLECAALGIPCIASRSKAYDGFADESMQFKDGKELAERIRWFLSWSDKRHRDYITSEYTRFYEKPSNYFGLKIPSYWLDANVDIVSAAYGQEIRKVIPPKIYAAQPLMMTDEQITNLMQDC